jgi:3-hydroxybutyryl-CoA dehydratase
MIFEELKVGMERHYERQIDVLAIDEFARLSGDDNPLHMNPEFARQAGFRDRVVHGALLTALLSRLVGTELPGRHSLLLSLKLDFPAPTFPNDTVVVMGQVESLHQEKRAVLLRLRVTCGEETRARGSALVRVHQ